MTTTSEPTGTTEPTAETFDTIFSRMDATLAETQAMTFGMLPPAEQTAVMYARICTLEVRLAEVKAAMSASTWARPSTYRPAIPAPRSETQDAADPLAKIQRQLADAKLDADIKSMAADWYRLPRWVRWFLTGEKPTR
jgi:hypothetical protein